MGAGCGSKGLRREKRHCSNLDINQMSTLLYCRVTQLLQNNSLQKTLLGNIKYKSINEKNKYRTRAVGFIPVSLGFYLSQTNFSKL